MNDVVTASTAVVPGFWMMMLKSIGMLCVVLAILAGLLFLFKLLAERRTGRTSKNHIHLLSSFHISPKEKLMLIDVVGEKLLIGVTQNTINTLAVIDNPEAFESVDEQNNPPGFKSILDKLTVLSPARRDVTSNESDKG